MIPAHVRSTLSSEGVKNESIQNNMRRRIGGGGGGGGEHSDDDEFVSEEDDLDLVRRWR